MPSAAVALLRGFLPRPKMGHVRLVLASRDCPLSVWPLVTFLNQSQASTLLYPLDTFSAVRTVHNEK